MTVGTGIFLGLTVIAGVWLYGQTKDRWRWTRIGKWVAVITALPLLAGVLWFAEERIAARPRPTAEYGGVTLGATKREVIYALGQPTEVQEDKEPENWGREVLKVSELKDGTSFFTYRFWAYGGLTVEFALDTQRVAEVDCFVLGEARCPSLLGISAGATEDDVVAHLGTPSKSNIADDLSGVKTLTFTRWNAEYFLDKKHVYGFALFQPGAKTSRFREPARMPPCKNGAPECAPWERAWSESGKSPVAASPEEQK